MSIHYVSRPVATTRPLTSRFGSLLAAGLLTLTAQSGFAQSLFQANGQATLSPAAGCMDGFTVTPDQLTVAGAVWRRTPLTLARSFDFTCQVYLGTKDDNGADGITFTLQRSPNGVAAEGDAAQNLGVSGITPSFSIEVDTYDNGAVANDIADDHLALFRDGSVTNYFAFTTPAGTAATAIAASGSGVNIEDGAYHPFRVRWNTLTKTLRVYFDGNLRATYTGDLAQSVFGGNSTAYWGFTGSTGGFSNLQTVCSPLLEYDQDSDDLADRQDLDDDNDGLADLAESGGADATGDADNDGVPNYQDADFGALNSQGVVATLDADGDGRINQFDLDSDADGLPDVVEGTDGAMSSGFRALYGAAAGQYTSAVDANGRPTGTSAYTTQPDTDGDGQPDYLDLNADGDRYPDWTEGFDDNSSGRALDDFQTRASAFVAAGGSAAYYPATDADANGYPDWLDDANGDGVPNYLDYTSTFYHDADADGLADLLDPSSLGTGYADVASQPGYPDFNRNQVSDYRDPLVATPLPVTLAAFTAQAVGPRVQLRWQTASELNSARFVVERSLDGSIFATVATLPAAGTSTQPHRYAYDDVVPSGAVAGMCYYRLRCLDADGTTTYSPVRTVPLGAEVSVTPNPTTGLVELRGAAAGTPVQVLDALGRTLYSGQAGPAGMLTLTLPAGLPAGVYLLRVQAQTLRLLLH